MRDRTWTAAGKDTTFKTCNTCNAQWSKLDAFLNDPAIRLVGYMPTFDELVNGLFLFNHDCGTTLACEVGLFTHLYEGPVYAYNRHGSNECPRHCQHETDLSSCPVKCNCAYVRETLQVLKKWPKSAPTEFTRP